MEKGDLLTEGFKQDTESAELSGPNVLADLLQQMSNSLCTKFLKKAVFSLSYRGHKWDEFFQCLANINPQEEKQRGRLENCVSSSG